MIYKISPTRAPFKDFYVSICSKLDNPPIKLATIISGSWHIPFAEIMVREVSKLNWGVRHYVRNAHSLIAIVTLISHPIHHQS